MNDYPPNYGKNHAMLSELFEAAETASTALSAEISAQYPSTHDRLARATQMLDSAIQKIRHELTHRATVQHGVWPPVDGRDLYEGELRDEARDTLREMDRAAA